MEQNTNDDVKKNANKKLVVFVLGIIIIAGIISLLLMLKSVLVVDSNNSNTTNNKNNEYFDENTYHFVAKDYNSLDQEEKEAINAKLIEAINANIHLDGKLLIGTSEFTKYTIAGGTYTNNFYKIHYNKNNFLYAYSFMNAYGNEETYYILDSEDNFNKIELKYYHSSEPKTPDWNMTNQREYNGWVCYYDINQGKFNAYYPLKRGYYYICLNNKKLTDEKAAENYFKLLSESFEIEEANFEEKGPKLASSSQTYICAMNDNFKNIELNDKISLNLVDNVDVLNWSYSANWPSTRVKMFTKDKDLKITLVESMNLNDLEDIKESTESAEFVDYNYKGHDITLMYYNGSFTKEWEGILLGFVINIDGRNYTLLTDLDTKTAVYKGSEQVHERIDYMYNQVFIEK